jgi:hypothetical protein
MIVDSFHPLKDELLQFTHDDFQSYLGVVMHILLSIHIGYMMNILNHPCASNFDGHETLVTLEQSETHTI